MRTILFCLFLCVSATWCAVAPPAAAQAKPAAAPKALADGVIEADIRTRFQRSKIRTDGFTVRVQGGVATIEGKTKVLQHKGVATRMAKAAGAKAVRNKVEVDEAARQRAADNLEKGRRRAQVKRGEVRTEPVRR